MLHAYNYNCKGDKMEDTRNQKEKDDLEGKVSSRPKGDLIQKEPKVAFTVYIPEWLWKDFKMECVKRRKKMNPVIKELMFEWVKSMQKEKL
jgi:hypothetical protein